ncbi:MAG TPA: hypothetical protein VJT72_23720, partial [Pseudonocardiaceae bacterium]|nr:hypothetical protein [Pseudonocardiaceae bacterium]
VPSGLVMQRFDGIDPVFLWQLNAEADRPDLAVILEADPDVIVQRLTDRGPHNRFQLSPSSSHAEIHFYNQAAERLMQAGFDVLRVDCNQPTAHHVASHILDRLTGEVVTDRATTERLARSVGALQRLHDQHRLNDRGRCTVCWPMPRTWWRPRPKQSLCTVHNALDFYLRQPARFVLLNLTDSAERVAVELISRAVETAGIPQLHPLWIELDRLQLISIQLRCTGRSLLIHVWDSDTTPPIHEQQPRDLRLDDHPLTVEEISQ